MKDPSESQSSTGDIDTLLQRIRGAVRARSALDSESAASADEIAAFDHFETALRDQARLSQSLLESVEGIASHVQELQ